MNPVNPYGDIDVTSYLQTEGRKRAAELALKGASASVTAETGRNALQSHAHANLQAVQQEASVNTAPPAQEQTSRAPRQAGSLTEVLQQMGVTGSGRRNNR